MKIKVAYLWASGSSPEGKFYIGVMSDLCPLTMWGGNKGVGRSKKKSSSAEVGRAISEKQKEYTVVHPAKINKTAIDSLISKIVTAIPRLKGVNYTFSDDAIHFEGLDTPLRPKRSKNTDHFWI
jgi:hypothetical protein